MGCQTPPRAQVVCLVAQSCSTLCDPMNGSTSGFPALQYLLELAQTNVHWVNNAIQPSPPLLPRGQDQQTFFFNAVPCSTQDLSSWIRDQTCAPCVALGALATGPPGKSQDHQIFYFKSWGLREAGASSSNLDSCPGEFTSAWGQPNKDSQG